MKIIQRIAFASIVATSTAFALPSYAFMMDAAEATAVGTVDLTQAVDGLRQELKAGKTTCKEMLGKIDAAIEQVDSALDTGVADEKKYLGLRDELVEMRLNLPCLAEELAAEGEIVSDTVISQTSMGEQENRDGGAFFEGGTAGRSVGGGGAAGGGGFGGGGGGLGGGGIGGLGPLALGGIAAAIAIPVALGGNNNPGTPASPVK